MIQQEIFISQKSDLYGSSEVIVEYDDVNMQVSRILLKGADCNNRIGFEIKRGNAIVRVNTTGTDKEAVISGVKLARTGDELNFEKGVVTLFYHNAEVSFGDNSR